MILDNSKENISFIKKQNYYWRYKLKAEKEAAEKYKQDNFIKAKDWKGPR